MGDTRQTASRDQIKQRESVKVSYRPRTGTGAGAHPILQLQQHIGNRAVQRFLRRRHNLHSSATGPYGPRRRFDRSPLNCSTPRIQRTNGAGFDPGAVVDENTAANLDEILANSAFLQPYIAEKLKSKKIADADKFTIYETDGAFDLAYIEIHNKWDQRGEPAFERELQLKKGFYNPRDDSIHLRPQADQSHAMHEAIHKFTEPRYRGFFGRFIDEGTTQYFANKVQAEMGLPPGESHGYGPELKFAAELIAFFGEPFMAEQFFKQFDFELMLEKVDLTNNEFTDRFRVGPEAKEAFVRYLRRLMRRAARGNPAVEGE